MIDYVRELPEWAKLSPHLIEKADGFLVFSLSGRPYCVPLTKEIKKTFGISRKKDEIVFAKWGQEINLVQILMVIADSLYLQTRDTVGAEIKDNVMQTVRDGIEKMLGSKIHAEVETRFNDKEKLLKENNEKSQETH